MLIGREDVTRHVEQLSFSAVHPGGLESAQIAFSRDVDARRGVEVRVEHGPAPVWEGRVQQTGATPRPSRSLACHGPGAVLKERTAQLLGVDRDLTRWHGPSRGQQLTLLGVGDQLLHSGEVRRDDDSALPAVALTFTRLPSGGHGQAWYDAGPGLEIDRLYRDVTTHVHSGGGYSATWAVNSGLCTTDDTSTGTLDLSADLDPSAASYQTAAGDGRRFAFVRQRWPGAASGDGEWTSMWRALAVYGPHGIPRRGADPGGLYPQDVARWFLQQAGGLTLHIADQDALILPHVVYRDPTPIEQAVADMALLLGGWHWGTWPAQSILGGRPVHLFQPLPTGPTCHFALEGCDGKDGFDVAEDLDRLHNQITVAYTDPARGPGLVTRTRTVPELDDAGLERHAPTVNLGTSTQAVAELYGDLLLAIMEREARATGQATLRRPVSLPGGGTLPAFQLRPGIDAATVTDLPGPSPLDPGGRDFHIRRMTCTVDRGGPRTTLELGTGAALAEVLQARLAAAEHAPLAGSSIPTVG